VLGVSQPTADTLLATLESISLLREWTGRRRDRSLIYTPHVNLFATTDALDEPRSSEN
jgi:hypothetical protein